MDASEELAEKLLRHMGFQSVVYEPDGNVPPDFLVDGRIAVEVRRLNQNHDSGSGMRGLEETFIPLWQKIEKLAHSLGPANEESWFVFIRFSRPVPQWKSLEPKLRAALLAFAAKADRSSCVVYEENGFELEVARASQPLEHYFRMGGSSDQQSGGFIVAEMLENIAHCANEKLHKIAVAKSKYNEWWLVLPDHIGLGLSSDDRQQFLAHAKRPAGWDKIVVVDPRDPTSWFEF